MSTSVTRYSPPVLPVVESCQPKSFAMSKSSASINFASIAPPWNGTCGKNPILDPVENPGKLRPKGSKRLDFGAPPLVGFDQKLMFQSRSCHGVPMFPLGRTFIGFDPMGTSLAGGVGVNVPPRVLWKPDSWTPQASAEKH